MGLKSEKEQDRIQHAEELRAFKNSLEESWEEIKKNYYKPRRTKDASNDNYIEYESKGDKNKNLLLEDYLYIIKPFLRDMINNHNEKNGKFS